MFFISIYRFDNSFIGYNKEFITSIKIERTKVVFYLMLSVRINYQL